MGIFTSAVAPGLLTSFVDKFPHVSIVASLAGSATAILAIVKVLSVLLGFAGGVFSVVAGYYTFRVYLRKWKQAQAVDAYNVKQKTIAAFVKAVVEPAKTAAANAAEDKAIVVAIHTAADTAAASKKAAAATVAATDKANQAITVALAASAIAVHNATIAALPCADCPDKGTVICSTCDDNPVLKK